MAITMYLGLELDTKGLTAYRKTKAKEYFTMYDNDIKQWGADLASRFLGHRVADSKIVRRIWDANPGALSGSIEGLRVFRLSTVNSVLVIKLRFESQQYDEVTRYRKLSSQQLKGILRGYELDHLLVTDRSIYPVIGTITDIGDQWEPKLTNGWAHLEGDYVESKLLEQIVTRVAIERSILGWAVSFSGNPIAKLFHPAQALNLIRRWPVELLTDWKQISDNYRQLRDSLNLVAVRAEVVERAKDWWGVVGVSAALIGLVAALVGLYL